MNTRRELRQLGRWLRRWSTFAPRLVRNKPLEWMNDDGTLFEREQWSRRDLVRYLRPRYMGLTQRLECGCTRRRITGRFVLYAMECEEHGLRSRRHR